MGSARWYAGVVAMTALHHVRAADIAFMTELHMYSQLVRLPLRDAQPRLRAK